MKKGDHITVEIEGLKKLGVGYGKIVPETCNEDVTESREILVKNALPGERIRGRIKKKRRGKIEVDLEEILESLGESSCPVDGRCGGCLYSRLSYDDELKLKENYLKERFKGLPFTGLLPSPKPSNYRNKMEYTFGNEVKDGPLTLGLHERGRYYNILETPGCLLSPPDFEKIREAVVDYFRDRGESFYHKNTHSGFLRHLVLRRGEKSGEILVNLVTSSEGELDSESFVKTLLDLDLDGEIVGIINTKNDAVADAVVDEGQTLLYGRDRINESLLSLDFEITPFSFFQVNSEGAEVLYSVVKSYAKRALGKKSGVIFDLYSGTGTITQILSDCGERVYGIELNSEASAIAKENAKKNGIKNTFFLEGDVFKRIAEIDERPELIVVDPPRSGITNKALKKILALESPAIVYVSCNPDRLIEELPSFLESGYKVVEITSVDMFPRTPHAESVVLLERG